MLTPPCSNPRKEEDTMSGPSGGGGDNWRPTGSPATPVPGDRGRGKGGDAPDPCDITVDTPLNSPNPAALAGLKSGDVLAVRLQAGPPVVLVALAPGGQVVGSITAAAMAQIIACIRSGVQYQAEIRSIRGGVCTVRISRT
jgi:hypothetical protein